MLPFAVNRLAQAAALAALADPSHLRTVCDATAHARARFCAALDALRIPYLPSSTNFVAVGVGESGDAVARALLREGILVRDTTGFGLSGHVRVSMPTEARVDDVVAKLASLLPSIAPEVK
jgi:histidinol-phosphate aminotransferase